MRPLAWPASAPAVRADPTRVAVWRRARRVLVVRLDNLGDLLMTTPAIAALREGLPQARLTLLASPAGAAAGPHLPMLDAVIPWAAPWVRHPAPPAAGGSDPDALRAEGTLLARLTDGAYDAAVIFTVCTQSPLPAALLCRLAGIPLRLAHCRENPYALLSDWLPEQDAVEAGAPHAQQQLLARHEVRRQLDLVAAVGLHTADEGLRFVVRPDDRARLARRLQACGLRPGARYAVLHPGATAASRRWPAEAFGTAARALAANGCTVVFSGTADEAALAGTALRGMAGSRDAPVGLSLAGVLDLGELAALIEGAAVLVSNNSAPVHLAAALGTPVVDLYALTNPQHTPWRAQARVLYHDVPCRWCLRSACPQQHHDCLRRVPPQDVAEAALALMRPVGHPLPESAA